MLVLHLVARELEGGLELGHALPHAPDLGLVAPAATPRDVIGRINARLQKIYAEPAFREKNLVPQAFEPIVGTPADAFRCFMATELDLLVVGSFVMRKADQDPALKQDYKDAFELD